MKTCQSYAEKIAKPRDEMAKEKHAGTACAKYIHNLNAKR
jgi:hypothetical protein